MKEEVIREIRYYSPVFKRQVVEEYLAGGITQSALQRKYDIRGKCAILYWRRQLSLMQDNPVSCNLATITPLEMAQKKQITGDQELRQCIKELERQLVTPQFVHEKNLSVNRKWSKRHKLPIAVNPKQD